MLENSVDPSASNNPFPATVKRYAPPNQRNRNLGRRKSGEKFERTNSSYGGDGDKNLGAALRTIPTPDHSDASSSISEGPHPGLISLSGCARSEAAQLLRERWEAALYSYNDPHIDLSERPVYTGPPPQSAWGAFKLPHQIMSGSQVDFLTELRQAIQNHDPYLKP